MPGYFQFLNLTGRDQEAAILESKFGGANKIRFFSFTIPVDPQDKEKKRSQIRDLQLCNEIADRMPTEFMWRTEYAVADRDDVGDATSPHSTT